MVELIIIIIVVSAALITLLLVILRSLLNPRRIATVQLLLKQGKISQAIRLARQLISKDPRNPDAHYLLGLAYLESQKPELALMEFKTINNIGIFTNICEEIPFRKTCAKLYMQFHQYDEALKEYLLLINLEPTVAEHYYFVGDLFEERSRSDKAELYFQKAIELNPQFGLAYFRLGKIQLSLKKPIEARLSLEKSLKYDPDNVQAYFYLGKLMKENHDYVGALINFEKAEKEPSLKLKVLLERGTCYMSMNNYDNAISELERAVRLGQDENRNEVIYARYFLGLCYEKTRQFEKAVENWEKVYAKRPQFRDVAEKLSQYQDLRTDDLIKDFLTASKAHFTEICQDLVTALKLEARDISELPNGLQILAVESESKWRGARKMPKLIHIYRSPEPIDEPVVRSMHEMMKKLNIIKGLIINSTNFTRRALEFAETRPIDLYDKDKLLELLHTVEQNYVNKG